MVPTTKSVLLRIPNESIRQKVLTKKFWYVDTSMFHVSQWTQDAVDSTPSLQHIQLWAHLKDVPFDLIHSEGLSHIAGQIGEPKETDDWTLSLTSISIAHVKMEVNTSLPLPKIVEVGRSNGSFVEVEVEYPWIPPICSHCKELGHISRNCLLLPEPPKTFPSSKTPANNPTAKPTSNPTSSKIYCYSCKAQGHLMKNCPKGPHEWIEVSGRKKQTSDPMDSQSSEAYTSPAAEDSVPPGNASASHSAAEPGGGLIPPPDPITSTSSPPTTMEIDPPQPSQSLPTPLPDTTLPLPPSSPPSCPPQTDPPSPCLSDTVLALPMVFHARPIAPLPNLHPPAYPKTNPKDPSSFNPFSTKPLSNLNPSLPSLASSSFAIVASSPSLDPSPIPSHPLPSPHRL
ncbi:Uncharacterized protein Rs2_34394 [Raphanus sativus]|nr:Uncharacterized protein Rs2_34394 [Raphanus sativus]